MGILLRKETSGRRTGTIPRLEATGAVLAAAVLAPSVWSASTTADWKPFTTVGTYSWSASADWTAETGVPVSGDGLVINFDPSRPGTSAAGIANNITSTNDMGTVQLNTLNLSGTSTASARTITITGGALEFAGTGASINNTTGVSGTGGLVDYTVNSNILLDGDLAVNLNGAGGTTLAAVAGSTLSANTAGLKTVTISGAGNAVIGNNVGSVIANGSGQVGITMNGSGLLSLGGTNTFSGGVWIKSGTVGWNNSSAGVASSFGTGTIRIGDTSGSTAATLNFSKAFTVTNTILVQAGGSGAKILENTAGNTTATLGGLLVLNDSLTVRYTGTAAGGFSFGSSTSAPFITGTGNLILENSGTLYHTISGANPGFTGGVFIKSGTTRILGGSSLGAANAVSVDSLNNATFNLNQVSTTIAGLNNGANGGGLVINPGSARVLTLGGTGNYSFGGTISATTPANLALTVNMSGTQTLSGVNAFAGAITVQRGALVLSSSSMTASSPAIQGGMLKLDFGGTNAPANNILIGTNTVILGGVVGSNTLWIAGKADTTNTQTFNAFSLGSPGAGHLKLTTGGTGTLVVNMGVQTSSAGRTGGATLDVSMPSSGVSLVTTASNNTAGLMYNMLTINGSDLARNDGSNNLVPFTNYLANTATTLGGGNATVVDMTGGDTTLNGGGMTSVAGLRFNTAANSTITLASSTAARILTIGGGWSAGPILVTPTVGANLSRITGGVLQGISSRDLVIMQNNTEGDLQIDSVITDYGSNTSGLTKSGAGRLVLTAGNAYLGASYLNEGTIVVAGDASTGNSQTLTTSSGSAVITGVDTTGLFLGQHLTGSNIPGGATISAISGNSITIGVTPTSQAGSGTVTFSSAGGLGIKTGSGAVQIGSGATLQIGNDGSTGSLVDGQSITNNGLVTFRRSDTGLVFSNTISGTGGVSQLGSGLVTLSAANSYTGATTLNGGALQFSALNNLGSGTAIDFGGGALKWATGNTADISVRTVTFNAGGATLDTNGNDVTFANAVGNGGAGGLEKSGLGTLTLNGANSYTGATMINAGTLKLAAGASLASSTVTVGTNAAFDASAAPVTVGSGKRLVTNGAYTGNLTVNGTLGGSGSVSGTVSGSGLVSPGNSPGVLTVNQVDPSGNLGFAFEFTGTGSPSYGNAGASVNDVLRITNATTPFTGALAATNTVSVYLNVASLNNADVFKGAFYTDAGADFLTAIGDATFAYYIAGDGNGGYSFNGVNYYALSAFDPAASVSVSTLAENADFGGGVVGGYVTQFSVAVPEPSLLVLLGLGAAGFLRRRR